jgi:hypothetical protein
MSSAISSNGWFSSQIQQMCMRTASLLELYPLKVIYYVMLSKWTYLSVLKHPQDGIHQLVEVDHAGDWIFIQLLRRICNADFTL